MHCEGSFFGSLFGLLFWDIIFDASVPGVFATPYQTAPLDFRTDHFYARRHAALEARVAALSAMSPGDLAAQVRTAYAAHHGTQCVGVGWDLFPAETLATLAAAVGPRVVAGALHLLAYDHRHRRGGHPDLLVHRPQPGSVGEAMFVEVKSARDRLAPKQEVRTRP